MLRPGFNSYPQVMFRVVEKEANFSVRVRKKNSLEVDHVRVLQLSKKLEGNKGNLNELQSYVTRTGSIQVPYAQSSQLAPLAKCPSNR